ncbi:MAG: CHAT domain-containing protein, partial [Gammaproteobacteria bacterium]
SAPLDLPVLDYEKEEETILRIADRLGGQVHLDIVESATFDELGRLVSSLKPHVVHLSGHGVMQDAVGHFAFEDERGRQDTHDGREMAERLFAGRGVRLVFVSGCQSAQAGVAGLCQRLTVAGHVPLALGWGASIADDRATDFARRPARRGVVVRGERSGWGQRPGPHLRQSHPIGAGGVGRGAGTLTG